MRCRHSIVAGGRSVPASALVPAQASGVNTVGMVDHRWDPLAVIKLEQLLRNIPVRWWLSGGWAIDEFVAAGHPTRQHGDIDVSVPRPEWPTLWSALKDRFQLRVAEAGNLDRPAPGQADSDMWNIWARDLAGGPWLMQINLEESDGERWIYRRDPRVNRPTSEVRRRSARTFYGAPAVQLLYKAKAPVAKDERDWEITVPKLPADEHAWLAHAIATAHPESPWATRLTRN
jgi:hypothetical protein